MEEKKDGLVMVFVGVFVFLPVSIMSYSLWRTGRLTHIYDNQLGLGSSATLFLRPRAIRDGELGGPSDKSSASVLQSGYRFEARDAGKAQRQLDKYSVYQHLSRQSH